MWAFHNCQRLSVYNSCTSGNKTRPVRKKPTYAASYDTEGSYEELACYAISLLFWKLTYRTYNSVRVISVDREEIGYHGSSPTHISKSLLIPSIHRCRQSTSRSYKQPGMRRAHRRHRPKSLCNLEIFALASALE